MNKLKTFFKTMWRSMIDREYYKDVYKAKFSFSFKYLYFLLIIISFISSIYFSYQFIPQIPKIPESMQRVKKVVKNFYPQELVVTLNNGTLKTNVDEPYVIDLPSEFNSVKKPGYTNFHLITIDTKAIIDDYPKYNSAVLITKNAIVYPDKSHNKSGQRVYFLNEFKGYFVINRMLYDRLISKVFPYFNYVQPAAYILLFIAIIIWPFVGGLLYLSGIMFYLLFMSIILYFFSKIVKKQLSYAKIYQFTMHGITFPLIFRYLQDLVNMKIPFTYTTILLIWIGAVIMNYDTKKIEVGRKSS